MSTFKDRLSDVRYNPMLMQGMVLDELQAQLDGQGDYDVPDASHPFVFLLEASVLNANMNVVEGEALLRKLYPSMALTPEELYLHMADDDYIGRFATPAWTTFDLYLNINEVIAKALPVGDGGVRKLVVPRLTSFRVAETTFTLQYPIEIRIMAHGGLQVVYDTQVSSPIQTLETNMVDWDVVRLNRDELLVLHVPVGQFQVRTFTETINAASAFDSDFGFADQFYFARVYLSDGGSSWREIHTTHTEQVFDPTRVTAVLRVDGSSLNVKIPLVYFTQGMVQGEIRVDLYTTKGPIDLDLGSYQASQFEMVLNDIDDDGTYVSPLNTFNQIQSLNGNRVTGGSRAVDFVTLRDQVMNNTLGASRVPITHAQLGTELENRGYTVVTNIDNITNRQFLASRRLPAPTNRSISGGMGSTMGQLHHSMEELALSEHVHDNGSRITLKPSMLFQYVDGKIQVLMDHQIQALRDTAPDALTRQVNGARYLFTPFHYVMDTTNDTFDVRPYYLDAPEITRKVFVDENNTAQIQVSIDTYHIERIATGYRVQVKLKSGERFKTLTDEQFVLQMGYQPVGETSYASINGDLIGYEDDERVYQFDIETTMDIDAQHGLYTTNMSMFDVAQRHFATPLVNDFDFSFIGVDQDLRNYQEGNLDRLVQEHLLPEEFMVIARERLTLRLGHALTQLWRRNRSLVSAYAYRRYAENIPYVYTETAYERDASGHIVLGTDVDGNITYNILHAKGDVRVDDNGDPIYRYLKGDVILDDQGNPELIAPRKILREFTLLFLDGIYYFVTDREAVDYRQSVPGIITGWLDNDVGLIEQRLLEQSELYLYPTTTLGDTTATVREGLQSTVALDQHFYVNYYLSDSAYSNIGLREALTESTREIVSDMLGRTTIAVSDIVARLKANAGEDVISIEAGGLGGSNDFSTVSINDDSVRLTLRKRLVVLSNQFLAAQDDIDISFLRHAFQ